MIHQTTHFADFNNPTFSLGSLENSVPQPCFSESCNSAGSAVQRSLSNEDIDYKPKRSASLRATLCHLELYYTIALLPVFIQ